MIPPRIRFRDSQPELKKINPLQRLFEPLSLTLAHFVCSFALFISTIGDYEPPVAQTRPCFRRGSFIKRPGESEERNPVRSQYARTRNPSCFISKSHSVPSKGFGTQLDDLKRELSGREHVDQDPLTTPSADVVNAGRGDRGQGLRQAGGHLRRIRRRVRSARRSLQTRNGRRRWRGRSR